VKGAGLSQVQAASGHRATPGGLVGERAPWDWNRVITPSAVLYILPIAVLAGAAYWHKLTAWEAIWRSSPDWGQGYLIPLFAVIIAHFRLKELNPQRIGPSAWGLPMIIGGLMIRIWAQMWGFGFPGDLTFLVIVAVLLCLGGEMFKALWIPVAFMVLMIPWEPKYFEFLALPLQRLAAMGSEHALPLLGYTAVTPDDLNVWKSITDVAWVYRNGNELVLASGPLNVVAQCAGLHLLFTFVALGVLMAYSWNRPTWQRVVIMASSVPIAVLCNVLRILMMAVIGDRLFFETQAIRRGSPGWSTHVPDFLWNMLSGADPASRLMGLRETVFTPDSALHQSFGFLMLGLAFLLMWAELGIIDRFFIEEDAKPSEGPQAKPPTADPPTDAPAAGPAA
jgi:exosortase/archaeosortase family protein